MKENTQPVEVTANAAVVESETERRLEVRLSDDFEPLGSEYNLLQGFHFGSKPTLHDHPAIISLRLPPLGRDQLFENWWYKGEITYSRSGPVRIAECRDYTMASVQKEADPSVDFRTQTHQTYSELLSAVRSTTHTKLTKIWNYFSDINCGDEDFEKYRQFSIGRAEAFEEMGIGDVDAPTGTAIGSQDGSGLSFIALASNRDFYAVENPRQVSAFNYPRKYGPSSPKFSRGGFVSSNCHKLFLISGTAAVVGHESNFPYNTHLQSKETFKNLEYLCEAISSLVSGETQFALDENSILRVYLKNPEDYYSISTKIGRKIISDKHHVAFLHGTICRKELTIEIDGVKIT